MRDGDTWRTRSAIAGARVRVETLEAELDVDAIYRNSSVTA
jgi:hypothetical protein